jgi:hypothetical protein
MTTLAPPTDPRSKRLQQSVTSIAAGDFEAVSAILGDASWDALEADFWNASHPLSAEARQSLDNYLQASRILWHRSGLGQAQPIALYKTTLLSSKAIDAALRVLARIYTGCNLGYCAPPQGFWRTVYALTGYIISERFTDHGNRQALTQQVLQLWLMAWLNPLSLAPGRLPVAVRLVGILSKACSFTLSSPTHAGSGLAAADLLSDISPMPFARVPTAWEPGAPLYINAQDAAFTMRELAATQSRRAPNDVYESLLQSAIQVGLSAQELQDFVRRAMREFGYNHMRAIPRVGRIDNVTTVIGFIECWGAMQAQAKPRSSKATTLTETHSAVVMNHSDGGFLLRFELSYPVLRVGALLCLRGSETEPWAIAAVRWLEDSPHMVMAGCEVFCNFGEAKVAQTAESKQHVPVVTYQKGDQAMLIAPFGMDESLKVSQLNVADECWVIAAATEIGADWQVHAVLDVTVARGGQKV